MLFKAVEIVSAGAVQDQADRGYEYLIGIFTKEPLLFSLMASYNKEEMTLENGARILLTCATFAGLNGPHPNKVRLDEIELIHPNILNEGFSMSQEQRGYRAQDTLTSTRKVASGTVQKLLDEAKDRNISVYNWCVWEVLEPCTRQCKNDPKYGTCPAYSRIGPDGKRRCSAVARPTTFRQGATTRSATS
jgi:hypothetical protein